MRFQDVSIQPLFMGVGMHMNYMSPRAHYKILCLPRVWLYESVVLLLFIRTLSWVYLGRLAGLIRSFSPGAAAFSLAFASFFGFCLVYALLFRKVVSGQQSTGLSFRVTHLRHCATYSLCVFGHH